VEHIQTGSHGRPTIHINEEFLRWAYRSRLQTTSAISRFLGVSRRTVQNALLFYEIAEPHTSPFITSGPPSPSFSGLDGSESELNDHGAIQTIDNLLPLLDSTPPLDNEDPILNPILRSSASFAGVPLPQITLYTGLLYNIADSDLDAIICMLRHYYSRVGVTMLDGFLRALGYNIPQTLIHQSLLRIDPVQQVFEHIHICRRVYSVPGPNSLWHHDGQHGVRDSPALTPELTLRK
jgi:hypothetical protein